MYNQLRHLPDSIESHVICETTLNLDQFSVPRIHSIDRSPPAFLVDRILRRLRFRPHMGSLARIAGGAGTQVLHSHFGNQGWANAGEAHRLGLRHVVTFYGLDVNFLPREDPRWLDRYRDMFALIDAVLCEGPFMASEIVRLGCPAGKVHVHHLGVDLDAIPFRPRAFTPGQPLKIYIAGSFREKKGIPDAIEAAGIAARSIPVEITVLGDASSEARSVEEKRRILAAVERNGLGSRTKFLGYQPWSVFFEESARQHVFLSPSRTSSDGDTEGGAPVSIIEMAASGMPIVSTRHCDIPEVILDGSTGLLADEGDVDTLARHLLRLAERPGDWRGMLEAGRKRMDTEFDARIQGERLALHYRRIAAGGEHGCPREADE